MDFRPALDIYYYQFFDPDRDQFGNLSVFQFDLVTFQHASHLRRARQLGRAFTALGMQPGMGAQPSGQRHPELPHLRRSHFYRLTEAPTYFKKEVKQSSEMNYEELRSYIHDLQDSGFDVVRLRVQLQKKFAYPAIALVMAILAVPFSVSSGKRERSPELQSRWGLPWCTRVSGLFEAMGNVSQLPPILAAWSPDLIFGLVGGYLILKVPT